MESKAKSVKNRFTLKMLEALEEVKHKYGQQSSLGNLSVQELKVEGKAFEEKIKSCKKLLGVGATSEHNTTLSKMEELKAKIKQISVEDIKKSFNRRNESSIENIRRTYDEIDIKGCTDILYSLELNELLGVPHYERVEEGVEKLGCVMLQWGFDKLRNAAMNLRLEALAEKRIWKAKAELLADVKQLSGDYSLSFKIKILTNKINEGTAACEKRLKLDAFKELKYKAKFDKIAIAVLYEANALFILQVRQIGTTLAVQRSFNSMFELINRFSKKLTLRALKINAYTFKGLNIFSERIQSTYKRNLKTCLDQLVSNARKVPDSVKTTNSAGTNHVSDQQILPVITNPKPNTYFAKKGRNEADARISQSLNMSIQHIDGYKEDDTAVQFTAVVKEHLDKKMREAINDFYLADVMMSESSFKLRNSPETIKNANLNIIESRVISIKSDPKPQDETPEVGVKSVPELQRNDSMSRIEMSSYLKESVPDSEFMKYCELIFNSKNVNYNFSFDNFDMYKGTRQKTENDVDRYESGSFNENNPNFKDIDVLMQIARRINNSGEFKDRTVDFLKSVDLDNKQRTSLKDVGYDQSEQKKESSGGIEEISPTKIGYESNRVGELHEQKSSMDQLMELPIDQAVMTFIPIIAARCSMDQIRDKRELTAIKEESTMIDKSNMTASGNNSNMQESIDLLNSINRHYDTHGSGMQTSKFKNINPDDHKPHIVSPKNTATLVNNPDAPHLINKIDGLKSDFRQDLVLHSESYATSDSSSDDSDDSDLKTSKRTNEPKDMNKESGLGNGHSRTEVKRPNSHNNYNVSLSQSKAFKHRISVSKPTGIFDLKRWNENFKATALQFKQAKKVTKQAPRDSKVSLALKRRLDVTGPSVHMVPRLITELLEPKLQPHPKLISRTTKTLNPVHQPSSTQTINFKSLVRGSFSSANKLKPSQDETPMAGTQHIREHSSCFKKRLPDSSSKFMTPNLHRSPLPVYKGGFASVYDNTTTNGHAKSSIFKDQAKKFGLQSSAVKLKPKLHGRAEGKNDNAKSFNFGNREVIPKPQSKRNVIPENRLASAIQRAKSAQLNDNKVSFFNNSMLLNKENGSSSNFELRWDGTHAPKPNNNHIGLGSVKNKISKSHADIIKLNRPKNLQLKAASKFFEMG